MNDPQLSTLLETLRARPKITDIAERRRSFDGFASSYAPAADVVIEQFDLGNVRAERSSTAECDTTGALLYVHGGGYVIGSLDSHRHMVTEAGRAAGVPAYALDYRLAPEVPFPAPVEDTVAAYRALLDQGIAPAKIALGGDSAGGGLVVAALVAIRDAGLPQPACGWSISPWTDMNAAGESMSANADNDPTVQRDGILFMARHYLNGEDPNNPLASPICADLSGIAPLLIQVGSIETLLDDSIRLARCASMAGVSTRLDVWPAMPHVWHLFHPILDAGRQAIQSGGNFVRSAMADATPFAAR